MSSSLSPRGRGAYQAFTLIELLTVIAIIGILSAITFGVARGVSEQGRIARAQAELATLASALEAYKQYYGEYPMIDSVSDSAPDQLDPKENGFNPQLTDRAYNFFRALNGRFGPDHTIITRQVSRNSAAARPQKYGKSFIDPAAFALERKDKNSDRPTTSEPLPLRAISETDDDPDFSNALLDPWGNRYHYYYRDLRDRSTWKAATYILYSAGPNKQADEPSAAGVQSATEANADNIYAKP